ncbi:MAG: hypothetical protein WC619_02340 [Patescibacteria group bacterium]
MNKVKINIPGFYDVEINDFGESLTDQFQILIETFLKNGIVNITSTFVKESEKVFNGFVNQQIYELSDRYFENFTIVTENLLNPVRGQYRNALILWEQVLEFVKNYEKKTGKQLHKRTPYYFSSITAILSNNFDEALILMHLALEEDKRKHGNFKEDPAYLFLSLNDEKQNQYFKPFVDGMANFIKKRLDIGSDNYQKLRGGLLDYDNFRFKFLDNDLISDEMRFYFVYSIIRLWHLRKLHKSKISDNIMAPTIFTQSLGGLLIIIEEIIRKKYLRNTFGPALKEMSRILGWDSDIDLRIINSARDTNFDQWVDDCLSGNSLLTDFKLSYGLRNFTFHSIKSQKKLWDEYTRILQSVLNCLFKLVEV